VKKRTFDVHSSVDRFISLLVCFSLLLILIFGSVISSLPEAAFAGSDESNHGGGPETGVGGHGGGPGTGVGGPETGVGGHGGGSGTGVGGESDDNDDNDSDSDGDDDQGVQGSSGGPKAIDIGKCSDPGHEHNPFTNECEPIVTICPTSYSNTEVRDRLVFVADPFLDIETCPPTEQQQQQSQPFRTPPGVTIDPDSVLPKKP
jgi:hypothetical protein